MKTLSDFTLTVPDGFCVEHKGDCELRVRHGVFGHDVGVDPAILATLEPDDEPLFHQTLQHYVDTAVERINAARERFSA